MTDKSAMEQMVEWRQIKDSKGLYEISNIGDIRRIGGRILKPAYSRGYKFCRVTIGDRTKYKTFRHHREVAMAFIPNPSNKPCVNHKDGDKLNNFVGNLEWVTEKENSQHAVRYGLISTIGEKHPMHKLSVGQVKCIREIFKRGDVSQTELAKTYSVGLSTIGDIVRRRKWKNI